MRENCTGVNKTQTRSTGSLGFMRVNMKRTYYKGYEERIDNKMYCYLPPRASFQNNLPNNLNFSYGTDQITKILT